MTKAKTTSISVKCPDMTFAQPRRNSQIRVMSSSQMMKHGSEAHFAVSRRRSPSTIGNQQRQSLDYMPQDSVAHEADNVQSQQRGDGTIADCLRRVHRSGWY